MVTFSNRNLSPFWISLRVIGTGSSGAFNWRWQFPATNFFWYWNKNNTGSLLDCVGESYICKSEYFSLLTFCAKSCLDWSRTLRTWYELSALLLRKFLESTPLKGLNSVNLSFASQSPELQHLWFNLLFHMTKLDETRTHVRNSQQWCDVAKHTQGKRKEVGPNWARWEISLKASTHAVPLTSTDVSKG